MWNPTKYTACPNCHGKGCLCCQYTGLYSKFKEYEIQNSEIDIHQHS
jgi:predicted methyltransferase